MSSERESYEPNYLSPDYGTREDAPVEATPAPTSGPDFASAYDALEPAPSVYDEGYITPTPAPIVDEESRPAPAPVHAPYPQAGPPQGYGQQPYGQAPGQQPYGAPAYGYQPNVVPYQQPYPYSYPVVPDHPNTGAIFGLGIASLAVWVTAPIAWYLGSRARREIANGAPYKFSGLAMVGWIFGIIYTVLMVLFVGFVMLMMSSGL